MFDGYMIGGVSMQHALSRWWNADGTEPAAWHTYKPCELSMTPPHQCNPSCFAHGAERVMMPKVRAVSGAMIEVEAVPQAVPEVRAVPEAAPEVAAMPGAVTSRIGLREDATLALLSETGIILPTHHVTGLGFRPALDENNQRITG
mmetsp:Transcript_19393/g.39650  ORF Transcript_19393/g.39650 Transcript_19393/m.39650 type:complete len:146 (-) Transcript_19393:192-629(-)